MNDAELIARYPVVEWGEPQPVTTPDGTWLTCRVCTAQHGLKAVDLPRVGFRSHAAWAEHMQRTHPDVNPADD